MILQSAGAATVQTLGFNWQDSPIYQSMPAPYIWWEPSLAQYWTVSDPDSQNGALYNLGTLQPATFGTTTFYKVDGTSWTPPGGGTAQYMIDKGTDIETENDPLEITPASDYASTGVTLVAMIKSEGDPSPGTVYNQIGVGGVGFGFAGLGGGSDFIVPGIYSSGDILANSVSINGGQPSNTNFRCFIATFVSVNVLGTLFTRIQLYSNGTLVTTGDLGYSMESYAASNKSSIFGMNRFFFGSIMRFNYILSQTQVTTVTNYMRTIWGTLA